MTTNTAQFSKGLKTASAELAGFAKQAAGIALTGLVGAGGIAGIYKLVQIVGEMEQQTHRADVIFKLYSKDVIEKSKEMGDAFGVPREEFVKGANSLGALFKAEGFTSEQASKLATGFSTLAVNASRLTGIPLPEVMEKIMKGAAGSGKGLKDLGVYMNDDVVKAEAFKLGLVKLGGELTESAKIQARLSVISKGLSDANGQAGATANSVMGRWEAFTGRIANLAETIGTILLPLIGPGSEMQVALFGIQTWLDGISASMVASSNTVVGGAQVQVQAFGMLAKGVGFLADAWQVLDIVFKTVQVSITAGLGAIVQGIAIWSKGLDMVLQAFGFAKTGATDFLDSFAKDLNNLAIKQLDELDAKMKAPWADKAVDDWFMNASQKLGALQAKAAKPNLDLKAIGAPTKKFDQAGKIKFSHTMERGSSDAVNTILRSQFGGQKPNKAAEETAKNTAAIVDLLKQGKTGGLGIVLPNLIPDF